MNNDPLRFKHTSYRPDVGIEVNYLIESEQSSFDFNQYDHVMAVPLGFYAYRDTQGEWIRKPITGSGLGVETADIIRAIQDRPGILLTRRKLVLATGNEELYGTNLSTRLLVIRKAHGESASNQRFYISQRTDVFRLGWCRDFSWLRVEEA